MNANETKIVLSYPLAGTLLSYGKYNYVEKTSTGQLLPERRRLRTLEPPRESACTKQVILGSEFVKHSLKFRPSSHKNIHAYANWGKWSDEHKLDYWIKEYIKDMDIPISQASYAIL